MTSAANPEKLRVRSATFADAPQLAALAGQLGYASTSAQVSARFHEILQEREHVILVAERAGNLLAGYIEVFPFRTIGADPRIEIASLVVDESCRSQGAGRLLMEQAESWGRVNGFKEAGLRSNVIRDRAHSFYEKLGYRVNKTQKSFRKKL
ncbi:MAG TPA: GNAT family N-acetyltransferase [Candidatus Acidoferrales bacterium]|nr:GNAT family N-acetyltransferase [Candidatus Acidoferrales bacterium]